MKSTCWDTRATESIIKSGQKDTEASIITSKFGAQQKSNLNSRSGCFSNYSLVIPSNLSESNIFNHFKYYSSSKTDLSLENCSS